MAYKCLNCSWSGHWHELIHETMCPKCRCSTMRIGDKQESVQQMMQTAYANIKTSSLHQ